MPSGSPYQHTPQTNPSGSSTTVKRGLIRRLIIGTEAPGDFRASKIKLLRGQTALLCVFTGAVYAVVLAFLGDFKMLPWELVLMAGGVFAFYLNRIQYYTTSTILLFILTNALVYLFTAVNRPQEGTYFYYFMTSSISIILMWYYNRYFAVTMTGITVIIATLAYLYPVYIIPSPDGTSPAVERIVFVANLTVCLVFSAYILLSVLYENAVTENKMIQNHQELKKANEELDRFVYSASHDMRAPLSSLLGLINVAEKTQSPEEKTVCLRMMHERIGVMENFIKEVTDYSRNVRLPVKHVAVNVVRAINASLKELSFLAEREKTTIHVEVDANLTVTTDESRFAVVLNNLIANAIRYYDRSKPTPFITIRAGENPQQFWLSVEDNGMGINSEYIPHIFDMFYRATTIGEGSGLGLYIVQETVQKLGGAISVQSEEGKGTTFTLALPK